ncbi:MAG: MFS transporter, partial [Oscillospiraceae bacterium]|nr:MFS transporter [Oscillospiraceae bacterium]
FLGGIMVDRVCEPFMELHGNMNLLAALFGSGKGSGAAMMMFILGAAGSAHCIIIGRRLKKYRYS